MQLPASIIFYIRKTGKCVVDQPGQLAGVNFSSFSSCASLFNNLINFLTLLDRVEEYMADIMGLSYCVSCILAMIYGTGHHMGDMGLGSKNDLCNL